jgi:hypothetical protein
VKEKNTMGEIGGKEKFPRKIREGDNGKGKSEDRSLN